MKIPGAVVFTLLVLLPASWQPGMTAAKSPKTETVVDAGGNLRVPGDYCTAFLTGRRTSHARDAFRRTFI
jgi:hypothetical protein